MPNPIPIHPWYIYEKTLFSLGYGHPIWHASPEMDEGYGPREVDVGSVGYLDDGRFRHIFNARLPADHEFNRGRVPDGFEQFNPPNLIIAGPEPAINMPNVNSQSIRKISASAGADVADPTGIVSAGMSFSFECAEDAGAVLVLTPPAIGRKINTKRHIITYMREHFDLWFEFARNAGYELRPEDILFVSGTVKTTRWVCSAFSGPNYRSKKGTIKCDLGGMAGSDISVSIEDQQLSSPFYNSGPILLSQPTSAVSSRGQSDSVQPMETNQCIFVHYFKMKKRIFWKSFMKEAAGPHELPGGPGAEEGYAVTTSDVLSDDSDIEGIPSQRVTFDPVNALLDYILEHSEAQLAIASDRDVVGIFGVDEVPDDIYDRLVAMGTSIDVDEDGVGTVQVDWNLHVHDRNTSWATWIPGPNPEYDESDSESGDAGRKSAQLVARDARELREDGGGAHAEHRAWGHASEGGGRWVDRAWENKGEENEGEENESEQMKTIHPTAGGGHTGSVTALAISPDSRWVASGSDDMNIILWDSNHQNIAHTWTRTHGHVIWHLAFSPDSERLACSGEEGQITIWDVASGNQLAVLEGHKSSVHAVMWSPDGTKLASGSDDTTVRLWSTETYENLQVLKGNKRMVAFVLFSHDGRWLASGGVDYKVRLWDVDRGVLHKELVGHNGMVWMGVFDGEDRRIATTSDDGSVRIWKVETGDELVILDEHSGPVWTVAFSADGKEIVSGSSDMTVKVCDSWSGERVLTLEGHESMVNVVSFSPDGRHIMSASSDNTLKLWERRDGRCVRTFKEHDDKVMEALFSGDGKILASGSEDGTVFVRALSIWA